MLLAGTSQDHGADGEAAKPAAAVAAQLAGSQHSTVDNAQQQSDAAAAAATELSPGDSVVAALLQDAVSVLQPPEAGRATNAAAGNGIDSSAAKQQPGVPVALAAAETAAVAGDTMEHHAPAAAAVLSNNSSISDSSETTNSDDASSNSASHSPQQPEAAGHAHADSSAGGIFVPFPVATAADASDYAAETATQPGTAVAAQRESDSAAATLAGASDDTAAQHQQRQQLLGVSSGTADEQQQQQQDDSSRPATAVGKELEGKQQGDDDGDASVDDASVGKHEILSWGCGHMAEDVLLVINCTQTSCCHSAQSLTLEPVIGRKYGVKSRQWSHGSLALTHHALLPMHGNAMTAWLGLHCTVSISSGFTIYKGCCTCKPLVCRKHKTAAARAAASRQCPPT